MLAGLTSQKYLRMLIYRFKKKKLVEFCPVDELCSDLAQNGSCSLKDSRLRSCQDLVLCLPRGNARCGFLWEGRQLLASLTPSHCLFLAFGSLSPGRVQDSSPPPCRSGGSLPGCHVIHGMAQRCRFWL